MIHGSMRNNYCDINTFLQLSNDATERNPLIKIVVNTLNEKSIFSTNELSIPVMVKFNSEYQKEIIEEAKESISDSNKLLRIVTKLKIVMDTQKLNYRQASAWIEPDLQMWALQGILLIKSEKLSTETFLLIASYLSSMLIPEFHQYTNKLSLYIGRSTFFSIPENKPETGLSILQPKYTRKI
jgi:hypothetical protein